MTSADISFSLNRTHCVSYSKTANLSPKRSLKAGGNPGNLVIVAECSFLRQM